MDGECSRHEELGEFVERETVESRHSSKGAGDDHRARQADLGHVATGPHGGPVARVDGRPVIANAEANVDIGSWTSGFGMG